MKVESLLRTKRSSALVILTQDNSYKKNSSTKKYARKNSAYIFTSLDF